MSFASKLGASYVLAQDKVKLKTIPVEIGDAKFSLRVRIPLKKEMEVLIENISNPNKEKIEEIYKRLSAPVVESISQGGPDFLSSINANKEMIRLTDDDIFVEGTSIRQVAIMSAMWESRVEVYFHLLQSETGEIINETYAQISEEFPEQVIRQIVEDIESAIRPDYKASKKN